MLWQRFMIRLARSSRIQRLMQSRASLSRLAGRFVGGATLAEAIERCRTLREEGIRASLFYMGEYLSDPRRVEATVDRKREAAEALGAAGLDVHLSVDPTQIGRLQSRDEMRANAARLGREVARVAGRGADGSVDVLMLDMEDESLVDDTIALYVELRRAGLPAGLTLQAYLRRTAEDLAPLVASPGVVRLVKGAFAAGREVAFTGRDAIRRSYLDLARTMLSPAAAAAGFYPVFATHDEGLIRSVLEAADERGWAPDAYEIEMLHGVRPRLQRALAGEGVRVRAYVPFGPDWWPYAARRVGENPRNASLLARALASALFPADARLRTGRLRTTAPRAAASSPGGGDRIGGSRPGAGPRIWKAGAESSRTRGRGTGTALQPKVVRPWDISSARSNPPGSLLRPAGCWMRQTEPASASWGGWSSRPGP